MKRVAVCTALLVSLVAGLELTPETWNCESTDNPAASHGFTSCICTTVPKDHFTWTNLDCSRLNITSFVKNVTVPLFVRFLDLSRNHIQSLASSPFYHWNPLRELCLSHNGITSIPDSTFAGLIQLQILDLSHNSIINLSPDLLKQLKNLLQLNLNFNKIISIPPNFFNTVPKLESLKLSYNTDLGQFLEKSPDALSSVLRNGLISLQMNHINVSSIPSNVLKEAVQLRQLYITDNPFRDIPELFTSPLEVLDLSGCLATAIPTAAFIYLPSLKALYLDRLERLTVVEERAFAGLKSLTLLSMRNCKQLHMFHGLAFGSESPPVRHFSVARSGLHDLSQELNNVLQGTEVLELHGNPWRCDCNLVWFLKLKLKKRDTKPVRCYSPADLHSAVLTTLQPAQLQCSRRMSRTQAGLVVVAAVLFSVAVLFAAVSLLELVRRRRLARTPNRVGSYRPIVVTLSVGEAPEDAMQQTT